MTKKKLILYQLGLEVQPAICSLHATNILSVSETGNRQPAGSLAASTRACGGHACQVVMVVGRARQAGEAAS